MGRRACVVPSHRYFFDPNHQSLMRLGGYTCVFQNALHAHAPLKWACGRYLGT